MTTRFEKAINSRWYGGIMFFYHLCFSIAQIAVADQYRDEDSSAELCFSSLVNLDLVEWLYIAGVAHMMIWSLIIFLTCCCGAILARQGEPSKTTILAIAIPTATLYQLLNIVWTVLGIMIAADHGVCSLTDVWNLSIVSLVFMFIDGIIGAIYAIILVGRKCCKTDF